MRHLLTVPRQFKSLISHIRLPNHLEQGFLNILKRAPFLYAYKTHAPSDYTNIPSYCSFSSEIKVKTKEKKVFTFNQCSNSPFSSKFKDEN